MTGPEGGALRRRWWPIGAGLVGASALTWVLWRVDFARLGMVLAEANAGYLLLVPVAIATEQLVRAWKWQQLLHPIRRIGTLPLFGAIMAGYLGGVLIPFGASPLLRSWLVARVQSLRMSAVLATVGVDRLVDGVVFSGFVATALVLAAFPDPTGNIRLGLIVGGAGSLIFFALLVALARYKRQTRQPNSWLMQGVARLPARFVAPVRELMHSFADGIVWPRAAWRGIAIVLASILIKLIAVTHLLFAGLAFEVALAPAHYIFLIVFLGFLVVLAHFARVPGGFFLGAVFALDLLGVAEEQALAMALVVQFASLLTVACLGSLALWMHGVALGDLQLAKGEAPERS
jgi:glycosyltransferase 2 family protein